MTTHGPDAFRRRVLKAGVAATSIFLPMPYAWVWAQSEGALKLLRAPKFALVIGNGNYKQAPLKTPPNDARAIAAALKPMGFNVSMLLNATKAELSSEVDRFTAELARSRGIGLFYFAGHGVQLAWRNYVVPVDAVTRVAADIPRECVDVGALLGGIGKAANPLNVIILDACRDNPFLSLTGVDQKGLSQTDAPPSTLLAYATAPGNVASDGEGVNGLYTEYLLKEIVVPDAKVEDIFKRVRLQVRRRSNGSQIPWESTSLEEDFYFVPPQPLAARAAQEAERDRQQELAAQAKRRAEEEAERRRQEEVAAREAKLAAEEAARKQREEIAALEAKAAAEAAERDRQEALAAVERQRIADAAERKRQEELAALERQRAVEAAERKRQDELAALERQRISAAAAEQKRQDAIELAKQRAAKEAEDRQRQEVAAAEKQRADEEARRTRSSQAASAAGAAAELERLYAAELALWDRIKTTADAGALEDYLLRYPSGRFAELAQLKLDALLAKQGEVKVAAISSPANPYSKGTARADVGYRIGDRYDYRIIDVLTRVEERPASLRVAEVTDDEVIYNQGRLVTDHLGNHKVWGGAVWSANQIVPLEYTIGKRWQTRFTYTSQDRGVTSVSLDVKVADREKITLPAGTFNAFRVEASGWRVGSDMNVLWNWKMWFVPDEVRRMIAWEWHNRGARGQLRNTNRWELVSFRQA